MTGKKSSADSTSNLEYTGEPGHMPGVAGLLERGRVFEPGELPREIEQDLRARELLKPTTKRKTDGGEQ